MSAQGSPTSAADGGELSGSQIAMRMVQAAEAAVAAANAASTAINSLTSSSTGTVVQLVLQRQNGTRFCRSRAASNRKIEKLS